MNHWVKRAAAVGAAAVGSAAAAAAVGALLWSRATDRAVRELEPAVPSSTAEVFPSEHLEGLPEPVARYFAFALTPGQPLVRSARVRHEGTFRSGRDAPWSPFTSAEHFQAEPPGFVWDARIRMAPLVAVRVRDRYSGGVGAMFGKLGGLVPVVDERGSPEMASGALHRYLAEAVWFPTRLLPGAGLVWEAVDRTTARATLTDAGTTVSLAFTFGAGGEVIRVYTPERFRDVDGVGVPTPWMGRFEEYRRIDGMMIPVAGEVAWVLPDGPMPYWRGRIVDIAYSFDS